LLIFYTFVSYLFQRILSYIFCLFLGHFIIQCETGFKDRTRVLGTVTLFSCESFGGDSPHDLKVLYLGRYNILNIKQEGYI